MGAIAKNVVVHSHCHLVNINKSINQNITNEKQSHHFMHQRIATTQIKISRIKHNTKDDKIKINTLILNDNLKIDFF